MCCEPMNYGSTVVGECEECGSKIDSDGDSVDVCYYSPVDCEECGYAPCDGSC